MYQVGGGARFSDDYGWQIGAQFRYGTTNVMLLKKQIDEAKRKIGMEVIKKKYDDKNKEDIFI